MTGGQGGEKGGREEKQEREDARRGCARKEREGRERREVEGEVEGMRRYGGGTGGPGATDDGNGAERRDQRGLRQRIRHQVALRKKAATISA